jgi:catechol 2,3-dioxygenase-like lactoylglutathione lyase family enzyme
VADVERAAKFYVEQLGFRLIYLYGTPPFYGLVERDGAGLNFRHVDAPAVDPALRERESLISASIPVYGVEALHDEMKAKGVPLAQDLTVQPWGSKDFIVRDPDGNLICFGAATA